MPAAPIGVCLCSSLASFFRACSDCGNTAPAWPVTLDRPNTHALPIGMIRPHFTGRIQATPHIYPQMPPTTTDEEGGQDDFICAPLYYCFSESSQAAVITSVTPVVRTMKRSSPRIPNSIRDVFTLCAEISLLPVLKTPPIAGKSLPQSYPTSLFFPPAWGVSRAKSCVHRFQTRPRPAIDTRQSGGWMQPPIAGFRAWRSARHPGPRFRECWSAA